MEPDIDADKYVAAVINKDRVGGHLIKEKKRQEGENEILQF